MRGAFVQACDKGRYRSGAWGGSGCEAEATHDVAAQTDPGGCVSPVQGGAEVDPRHPRVTVWHSVRARARPWAVGVGCVVW